MSADAPARYGLTRPTMGDALIAVRRAHGVRAGDVWSTVLADAGLMGDETDDDALRRILHAMQSLDPVTAVIVRSLRVRIAAYAHLARGASMSDTAEHLQGLADPQRLRVLASIDLDDVGLKDGLDAITARTAGRLGLPISLVSLVLDSAQVLAGSYGVSGWIAEANGTPAEWAFCAHTVHRNAPYIVPDAAHDPVQATNPLVTQDGIGSYAGVPLVIDGQALGVHCVVSSTPHTFTDAELAELHTAAAEVVALLQRYRRPAPRSDGARPTP